MREISLAQIASKEPPLSELVGALQAALVEAMKSISHEVNVEPPKNIINVEASRAASYLIEVNRDGSGRIQSMLVRPYEPS